MKNMARRFSSQMADPPGQRRAADAAPLLAPLYRYSDPDSNIVDGAIFGFATNGVNPDLHVMIEIVKNGDSKATWRYGLARMTIAQLKVKLDETEVWSVPYVTPLAPGKIASFDTWAFSWETHRIILGLRASKGIKEIVIRCESNEEPAPVGLSMAGFEFEPAVKE